MENKEKLIKEFETLLGSSKPEDIKRKEEIARQLEQNPTPEVKEQVGAMVNRALSMVDKEMEEISMEVLRSQIDDKAYKLIPWSYIAKEYFGKSVSWLTQRINGYTVRGHVYTLNAEQKETLNRALTDIGKYIGSYRFA